MEALLNELGRTLQDEIPLTRAIGISPAWEDEGLELWAPLAPNVNHKDTAFAGSLASMATLAGWSFLWLLLRQEGLVGKIVIQDCSVRYLRPVTREIRARCAAPDPSALQSFLATFRKRGRARIELRAEIREGDQLAVELVGRYVAHQA